MLFRSGHGQIPTSAAQSPVLYNIDSQVSHYVGRQESGPSPVLPGHLKALGTHGTYVSYDPAKYTSPLRVDGLISRNVTGILKTVCTVCTEAIHLLVACRCSESDEAALVGQYHQGYLGPRVSPGLKGARCHETTRFC
jgi:hypothetical protein